MKTKKIILFIVEGISDQTSLALILSKLIKTESIRFHIIRGDITCDNSTTVVNCITKINEHIKRFLSGSYLKKTDLLKIIHLVDTDGAFVNEDYMQESEIQGFMYSSQYITARSIENVLKRNEKKSNVLNKLCTCPQISGLPYFMYYFSCNLEHVLHNECNMDDNIKDKAADEFADMYYGKEEEFVEFISKSEFTVQGEYKETWDFIKADNHSLQRHCNFHLFFQ